MLESEFTAWAGENKVVLNAGESFLIPLGIPHVVGSLSDHPVRALVVTAPSGFARLIAATGTLDKAKIPDMALIERIADEIGDEILDPPGALPSSYALAT